MTDIQRAFCMGNALVVGIPHMIGRVIAERMEWTPKKMGSTAFL